MSIDVELDSIELENVRGFSYAKLDLSRERVVFVGRNNSGKTSVLLLLDWLINRSRIETFQDREIREKEIRDILIPARNTRSQARRFSVYIKIHDGRRRNKFQCDGRGVARLRIGYRTSPAERVIAKLGDPSRGETVDSDEKALGLLDELKKSVTFVYIPSFRDVGSERFNATLTDALRSRLAERALHNKQGGAPREYRQLTEHMDGLRNIAENLASPLWEEMKTALPPEMVRDARISMDCDPEDIVEWLSKNLAIWISTGEHDNEKVEPISVGSGLQSLLALAINQGSNELDSQWMLAIEEPEAFLHPSAQRLMARRLLNDTTAEKLLITTHSPLVIDEAEYQDIVVTSQHRFFQAASQEIPSKRAKINSELLSRDGSELLFAKGALLVEGPGDKKFFEEIRRRLAKYDEDGDCDQLFVLDVGGKNSFSPWIKLLRSFKAGNEYAIQWIVVADGDATTEVHEAYNAAVGSVPREIAEKIRETSQALGAEQCVDDWYRNSRELNDISREQKVPIRFLPVDLESAILNDATPETLESFADQLEVEFQSRQAFIKRMGSKGIDFRSANDAMKAPYIRGHFGRELPGDQVSDDMRKIVFDWLTLVMPETKAEHLIDELCVS